MDATQVRVAPLNKECYRCSLMPHPYMYLENPPVPIEPELAPMAHAGGLHGYEDAVKAHIDIWIGRRLADTTDTTTTTISKALIQGLREPLNGYRATSSPQKRERERLRVLYGLAISHLLEDLLFAEPEEGVEVMPLEDGRVHRVATVHLDMMNTGTWPFEARIHATSILANMVTAPLPEGAKDGWYYNDARGVYLRRTDGTIKSPPYPAFMAGIGIEQDFSETTLFPYMAAKKP